MTITPTPTPFPTDIVVCVDPVTHVVIPCDQPVPIPTLSEWGLLALGVALAVAGIRRVRA